ncbi:TRL-like family protein [Leptospira perolatii]|uniref:TRL-like family protein n=1 Tax=Leptospira perolatii TaxID=2023191 RepID=A0A2M9ZQ31_9LEPT|nr:TRL domain-containing protein [Leptospira perolatii]PJZ68978.1 TRL-like family protein [Leptospira perolatii]PJZ74154.1 TRL-like family protein [Leptospira perolatii]
MNRLFRFLFITFSAYILAQCVSTPEPGIIYTNHSFHISTDPAGKYLSSARILKRGEACSFGTALLYLGYYGQEVTLKEAMVNGKISKVALVDRSATSYLLGIAYFDCIEVWGE